MSYSYTPTGLQSFVAIFIGIVIGIFAHEAGHVVAGRFLGFQSRLISIGVGPILLRHRVGDAWLIVRAAPLGGYVLPLPFFERRRLAYMGFVLGGILGNIALVALSATFAALRIAPDWFCQWLATVQGWIIVMNLLPVTGTGPGHACSSDGLKLLRFLFGWQPDFGIRAKFLASILEPGGQLLPPGSGSAEIVYLIFQLVLINESWSRRDCRQRLHALLADSGLQQAETALIAHILQETT